MCFHRLLPLVVAVEFQASSRRQPLLTKMLGSDTLRPSRLKSELLPRAVKEPSTVSGTLLLNLPSGSGVAAVKLTSHARPGMTGSDRGGARQRGLPREARPPVRWCPRPFGNVRHERPAVVGHSPRICVGGRVARALWREALSEDVGLLRIGITGAADKSEVGRPTFFVNRPEPTTPICHTRCQVADMARP